LNQQSSAAVVVPTQDVVEEGKAGRWQITLLWFQLAVQGISLTLVVGDRHPVRPIHL